MYTSKLRKVGGADDFGTWSHPKQKKNKKDYCSVCSWLGPELELNIFINKKKNGGLVKKNRNFFRRKSGKHKEIIIVIK